LTISTEVREDNVIHPDKLDIPGNDRGFALISSMIFLVLLTIIGIAATNTAVIETMISASEKNRQRAFFAAEAGIEHGKRILMDQAVDVFETSGETDWDFALKDDEPGVESTDYIGNDGVKESFIWINSRALGNTATYTVMVRDNDDDSDPFDDVDNIIIVTSIATLTDGTTAGIQIEISSVLDGGSATGYSAQAGSGAGKSYKADDVKAISDFSPQTTILSN
jgi:type IV pilus assembly protein PilX